MRIHASINRMVNKEDSAIKAYASVTMDGMFLSLIHISEPTRRS